MKKEITILTEPITIKSKFKLFIKTLLGRQTKYTGHFAVTRSLVEGLEKIGYEGFNYRPKCEKDIAEHVHVLAGAETLRYAMKLKKEGKIKKLTAGPNVVVFATDYDSLIADESVDLYLQPSQWAADFHLKMEPKMQGRCVPWPAGVKIEDYEPDKYQKKDKQVIVYHKLGCEQFCYKIAHLLRKYGYHPIIIQYGSYQLQDYIKTLGETEFCIALSKLESQGLYLAEAWAMDVPTICFESNYYMWKDGEHIVEEAENISTCPYLTKETGLRFTELSELEEILKKMPELQPTFAPRKWVLENMTDEVCARQFLQTVGVKLDREKSV